jgi:hypothetical protein
MSYRLLTCLLALQLMTGACQQPAKNTPSPAPSTTDASIRRFTFDGRQQNINPRGADNWCTADFTEAIPLFPDPDNTNRRFFYMEKGTYKVGVSFGNISSRTILHWGGGEVVQISTSENFPTCLSNRLSFMDTAEPNRIHYDNQKHVLFDLLAFPEGEKTKVVLELDTNAGFGMAVYRCKGCQ